MPRIKVLQIVAGMAIGAQSGGAELFGVQLARHLSNVKFETSVFPLWGFGSQIEEKWRKDLEGEGIRVGESTGAGGSRIIHLRKVIARLWSFVSNIEPDIVNSHTQQGDAIIALLSYLHPCHPKSIRTVHIDQPWLNRRYMDIIFDKVLFPAMFEAEIAVSQAVRRSLDRRLVARLLNKKSYLCYNGVDAALFRRSESQDHRSMLPTEMSVLRPRIGVIGRLTKQKGHEVLFQAMNTVCETHSPHLLVIGTGPKETELREQARKLGISKNVHFLGSRSDVLALLASLDLVVSSSLWEGLPTVLLEAMAMEVPVVATNVSGSHEIVKNGVTGLLVPSQDPDGLAKAITAMLDDPTQARAMAMRAREYSARFTLQNAGSRYASLYERLAKMKTP
ncbi:MAG: glycosyltransferase [Anaerolineales bacterium]